MERALNRAQEAILRLVRMQAFGNALNAIKRMHPVDLAMLYPYLTEKEQQWFADATHKSGLLSQVVGAFDESTVADFVANISDDDLVAALHEMPPDDAVDVIANLPVARRQIIFAKISGPARASIAQLLGYAPDTAGGIMTTEVMALPEHMTVEEAIQSIRNQTQPKDSFYAYVIDANDRLVGVVSFRELVLSAGDQSLQHIMTTDPVAVDTNTNQEEVAELIARYNLLSLPVVDEQRRLIGRVTVDDAIDVLYKEATEDIYHLASLGEEEHVTTPIKTSVARRAPWLLLNLATALLAAGTVALFEETIARYVVLAAMMPIIAGMGGNAGTQSLAVVVRGLALGEIDWSLGWKAVFKEVSVGLLNGIINGFVMGAVAYAWYNNLGLALIMFLAMIANLVIAGLFGAIVPLALRKLRMDPALGSSIFVTTATDVGGFLAFLGMATLFIEYIAQ